MRENLFTLGGVYSSAEIRSVYEISPESHDFNRIMCKTFDLLDQDAFYNWARRHPCVNSLKMFPTLVQAWFPYALPARENIQMSKDCRHNMFSIENEIEFNREIPLCSTSAL